MNNNLYMTKGVIRMKKEEVKYILDQVGAPYIEGGLPANRMQAITALPGVGYLIFPDSELRQVQRERTRFIFDLDNELVEIFYVREYSKDGQIPPHIYYDIMDDQNGIETVYEYLVDIDKNVVVDFYSFEAILIMGF